MRRPLALALAALAASSALAALCARGAFAGTLYEHGLARGCSDLGWAPRTLRAGQAASIDFSSDDGWMIGCPGLQPPFASLRFRVRAGEAPQGFLAIQLDGADTPAMPRVPIAKGALRDDDGWTEVTLPFALLNPQGVPFQRIIFRATRPVASGPVLLDSIALLADASAAPPADSQPAANPGSGANTPGTSNSGTSSSGTANPGTTSSVPSNSAGNANAGNANANSPVNPSNNSGAKTNPGKTSSRPRAPASEGAPAEGGARGENDAGAGPPGPAAYPAAVNPSLPRHKHAFTVRCDRPGHPISPDIYGVGYGQDDEELDRRARAIGATARRWGGNTATRYNWRIGNVWNTGSDWFFQNVSRPEKAGPLWKHFLAMNDAEGVNSAITVPLIGWVSKDNSSVSFPVSLFGAQQGIAPENHEAGNGISMAGNPIEPLPPTQTSVQAGPQFVADWVKEIKALKGPRRTYILDNEPGLWAQTHRDVHPEPLTYDEQLQKQLAGAKAIRAADPDAKIAGPAEWGWANYFWSADDLAGRGLRLDRLAHGNAPLIPWLLQKFAAEEKKTHTRLLDIVDVHFYPQSNVGIYTRGETDPSTSARRIRSTRGLWDPNYVDESWIKEPIRLLPRMKEWIAENRPGLGISIGEWNFGAETHMSGGLATAEALGLFAAYDVTSAYYWIVPAENSPAAYAFRAFRNYDGGGGRFLDFFVPSDGKGETESLYVSRDGDHLVALLLNFNAGEALEADIDVATCGSPTPARAFSYTGASAGFTPVAPPEANGSKLRAAVPAYSMTVLDIDIAKPEKPAGKK